ncbi:magnesium chelatase domain-containing protein [Streptomyces griseoviridis]|uniref:magnesium chelatase domain-containing protein n=1 Tax=Streptomyces griseoviridis TaxID=45398 RepID=UPI0034012515
MIDTPNTAAMSRACKASADAALAARTRLLCDTVSYVTRLIRDVLPTAAVITVDTDEKELHEVRDATDVSLWHAPVSGPTHQLNDGLVDDVNDLFRQSIPFGGLAGAGWSESPEGWPYRDIQLPEPVVDRTAVAKVRIERCVHHVTAHLTPADTASFTLVGPEGEPVHEARDRVRAAILNAGYQWPDGELNVRVAGCCNPGSTEDLAIACAILATAGHIDPAVLSETILLGELGLDGSVRDNPSIRERFSRDDLAPTLKRVLFGMTVTTSCPTLPPGAAYAVTSLREAVTFLASLARD